MAVQNTYKKLSAMDLTEDLVTQDELGNNAVRVEGSLETVPADIANSFNITTVDMPLASTEYSWAVPDGVKKIKLRLRKPLAVLEIYAVSSGSDYYSLSRGNSYEVDGFVSNSNTLYFKTNKPSLTVEIIYWT